MFIFTLKTEILNSILFKLSYSEYIAIKLREYFLMLLHNVIFCRKILKPKGGTSCTVPLHWTLIATVLIIRQKKPDIFITGRRVSVVEITIVFFKKGINGMVVHF